MKKNVLKDIDKMKEERKLSKDVEKKIFKRTITNFGFGISIILLVMIFYILANYLSKNIATFIYNSIAFVMLIATLIIIEIAYKKDSGKWAIAAIEMLIVSIYSLFAPFIILRSNYKYIYGFIALTTIYYSLKIIKIYFEEGKEYYKEISDITKIIQKESKDELAEKEKIKQKEEIKKMLEIQKKEAETKKVSKKSTTSKKTKTSKTTTKTPTKRTTATKTGGAKKKTVTKKAPKTQKDKQGE